MMHEMANTLIVADHIKGMLIMDKANVNKLIVLINSMKASVQKDTFLEIANRWKIGDFAKVDEDHHAVWIMIPNAEIGEATGLNDDAITQAILNMK